MLLTAARFYSSPTTANSRLLFRASLMHLPIWMAAFLVHRQPNVNDAKLDMLWHNVRLLGIGQPVEHQDGRGTASASIRSAAQQRLSFPPPLPFLPIPDFELSCPSKAVCAADQGEPEAAAQGARAEEAEQEVAEA